MYSTDADPTMMLVPQLDIHPFVPSAAVPGAPVGDSVIVQNSAVIPHYSGSQSQYGLFRKFLNINT